VNPSRALIRPELESCHPRITRPGSEACRSHRLYGADDGGHAGLEIAAVQGLLAKPVMHETLSRAILGKIKKENARGFSLKFLWWS